MVLATFPASARAEDPPTLDQLKREIERIKSQRAREVKRLESEIDQIKAQRAGEMDKLEHEVEQLQKSNQELEASSKQLNNQVQQQLSPAGFQQLFGNYLGQHQFTVTGGAAGDFIYDHEASQNTFSLAFEPIILYRISDWLLFEGTIEASLGPGTGASFDLPVATAQVFLNDYAELLAGIFDQPFGDWYEDQSPLWVNPFITAPLVYGSEAVVPPTDLGFQLRGGVQWGELGQVADYTLWLSNGPSFESAPGIATLPNPVLGETLNPVNNIDLNTNGKGYGARFRVYPLPVDWEMGRLELEASTFNGKWLDGLWYNSWGVGYAYRNGAFRSRGEWVQAYRQMPSLPAAESYPGCCGHDNREGWYLQLGYFLYGLPHPTLGSLEPYFDKTEFLVRYSGVNQRAVVAEDIATSPSFGFGGSPSVFSPHAREVALGVDYWLAPSIVWQTEVDLELPRQGGTLYTFGGSATPTASAIHTTTNDQAVLTQFAIGF